MANTDLKNNIALVQLYEPQDTADTDAATNILDTLGFESAVVAVNVGTITGVADGHDLICVLQESDTTADADFTSVASADIEGAFTEIDATTEDQCIQTVGYKGTKRYIRVLFNFTGTSITACLLGVIGILGNPREYPPTAPAAVAAT